MAGVRIAATDHGDLSVIADDVLADVMGRSDTYWHTSR